MDVMVIVVSLGLIGLVLFLVLYPLWQQTQVEDDFSESDSSGQTLEELQLRYQASLAAIKDLMFDQEMGKVAAEDYETFLNKAKVEAARLRQQIDQIEATAPAMVDPTLEREIERLIAQTRRRSAPAPTLQAEVEAEIEALKTVRREKPAGSSCPHCGRLLHPDDAFCSGCGQAAARIEVSPPEENCPQCGYSYQPGDAFCARCGAVLATGVEVPDYEDTRL